MGKKSIETFVGIFVLLGMAGVVFLALKAANLGSFSGADTYTLTAYFDNIGALKVRAPVRSAGVTVGRVASIKLDPKLYQGVVELAIQRDVQFPTDSSLRILTSGLLGDQYVGVEPGASDKMWAGGRQRQADPIGGGPGKPDQPVPVQQGGGCGRRARAGSGRQRRQEMKCSLRLGSPSRRVALLAVVLAALAGCDDDSRGARRAGPATRSLGELESQGLQLQRRPRQRRAQAGRDLLCRRRAAAGAAQRHQLLQQLLRRLVGDQQHAAGQVRARLRGRHPGRREHAVRPARHPRRRIARWASSITTRTSARRSAATASAPAPTSSCRSWAPRPSATRRRRRSTGSRRRRRSSTARARRSGFTLLQIINTRADLLGATRVIDDISLDKYTFIRDAYLQRRRSLVFDGDVPETPETA